jgi:gas vesicle protein
MRDSNELLFFFLGIAVGVIATLLTAPYSGEETRQYLRDRLDEGRASAEGALEKGKEFVERQGNAIGNAVGYGRKTNPEGI